ncbi:MAG: peptide ABC transporter substrate-binding protein [Oscillospiraceae bacterium]|nr:peptide ABC transporter substrate-binding protein [Oscillospiraceae bacterium]
MKITMKATAILLAAMMIFCGCNKTKLPEDTLRYDLRSSPNSLDPQYAVSDEAIAVVKNAFEGLTAISKTGEVVPACAESWKVSADKRSYTFLLRDDLHWANGDKLVAQDFVFALKRLFNPVAVSPAAADYIMIKNAEKVMSGEFLPESLGVRAKSDRELVITLERDDPSILTMLSMAAASPCQEKFFDEQKGRYGLDADTLLCNGPFKVQSKSDRLIGLKRSDQYREPVSVENINMYINRGDEIEIFMQQRSDMVLVPFQRFGDVEGASYEEFYDQSWLLLFNTENEVLKSRGVRAALYSAADIDSLLEGLPEQLKRYEGVIPPSAMMNGREYRDMVSLPKSAAAADSPRELFYSVLKEMGFTDGGKMTLLVSSFAPGADIGGQLQRRWQESLSLFVNMEQLEYNQLIAKVERGEFDIAIVPLVSQSSSPIDFLANFEKLQTEETVPKEEEAPPEGEEPIELPPTLGELIASARAQTDAEKAAEKLFLAEQRLIDDVIAAPLFAAPSLFAVADGVSGVYYDPVTRTVSFADAVCIRE